MEIGRYFDWAATAAVDGECAEIQRNALEESLRLCANPSSQHSEGLAARRRLEEARDECAAALGVRREQVFFTGGGTEGDHIPLLAQLLKAGAGRIAVGATEHPAVREMAANVARLGWAVDTIPAAPDGFVTAEAAGRVLRDDTRLVSVMAVNNETGNIMPFAEIAREAARRFEGKRRPHVHVDCVQAAGKIELDLSGSGIDSASISAHKLGGPRGAGILYLAEPQKFRAFLAGGGQEGGVRSGTESLFGALATAGVLSRRFFRAGAENARLKAQESATGGFVRRLLGIEGCSLVPRARERGGDGFSAWVVQAAFRGIPGNVMVRALDAKGFCISTGSACSSRKQSRPVLQAMGVPRDVQDSAVRFSFGWPTTRADMDSLADAVRDVCAEFA